MLSSLWHAGITDCFYMEVKCDVRMTVSISGSILCVILLNKIAFKQRICVSQARIGRDPGQ